LAIAKIGKNKMITLFFLRLFAASTGVDTNVACKNGNFLGIIPPWYRYLRFDSDCSLDLYVPGTKTIDPSKFWLIGFGLIDILLRVAGLVAVGYVVYGGFRFITSQGDPEKLKNARNTLINALIGVAIAVLASSLVSFLAVQFK
jgi:hypothetical protein